MQQFRKSVPFSKLFKETALYESTPAQALGDYCFQKLNKIRKLDINIPNKYLIDAIIGEITDENVARKVGAAWQRERVIRLYNVVRQSFHKGRKE